MITQNNDSTSEIEQSDWFCVFCYTFNRLGIKVCSICLHTKREVETNFICYECPRCCYYFGFYKINCSICPRCKNNKPQTWKDFISIVRSASKNLLYLPRIIVTNKMFSTGYRNIDYTKSNLIGRTVYWTYGYEDNKLRCKIVSIHCWSGCVTIASILDDNNAPNPIRRLTYDSLTAETTKEYHILEPIVDWYQLKQIFIAYYKESDSPFSMLSYEIFHHIVGFLLN